MNGWLIVAAALLVLCLAPCVVLAARGEAVQRLIVVNLAGTVTAAVLLLLAQGYGRSSYVDVALVTSLLTPIGTLVFTRLLRGLPEPQEPLEPDAGNPGGSP